MEEKETVKKDLIVYEGFSKQKQYKYRLLLKTSEDKYVLGRPLFFKTPLFKKNYIGYSYAVKIEDTGSVAYNRLENPMQILFEDYRETVSQWLAENRIYKATQKAEKIMLKEIEVLKNSHEIKHFKAVYERLSPQNKPYAIYWLINYLND